MPSSDSVRVGVGGGSTVADAVASLDGDHVHDGVPPGPAETDAVAVPSSDTDRVFVRGGVAVPAPTAATRTGATAASVSTSSTTVRAAGNHPGPAAIAVLTPARACGMQYGFTDALRF